MLSFLAMLTVTIHNQFEAAVKLYNYDGKCGNIHGHTYKVSVVFYNDDHNADMVVDYFDAKRWVENAISTLDHGYINEIKPFDKINPTTENVCKWLFQCITDTANPVKVLKITLAENESFCVSYEPNIKNS